MTRGSCKRRGLLGVSIAALILGSIFYLFFCVYFNKSYVKIGNIRFYVEVADTPQMQRIGLMYRKSLPERRGMLFIFKEPKILYFWMKNTYIPLDIIFIDKDLNIINIETMPALTTESCRSSREALYVLEVPAGTAEKYGIKAGMKVELHLESER